ncbi:hypothetical protein WA1_29415 [Scytonema hofmannii PCC 7110]|uniref:Uncharacterized protein n=1 Tax=Scytonema hofmannii PCC 7110 TaxID=128403 RepID=A0A139X5X0_9CYAN|nr:hypothetical protein [Scytonema hofmannii]KYC40075.1 hypothetical protein WA1_29415 [Scytonema hofmannii PCC 7110]
MPRLCLGTRLRRVTGHWLLVTGHWLLVTGYWLLVTAPHLPNFCRENFLANRQLLQTIAMFFAKIISLFPNKDTWQ